jgi:hypothetical protein
VISNRVGLSKVVYIMTVGAILSLAGCTPDLSAGFSSQSSYASMLTVLPSSGTINAGQVVQLQVPGGRAPFTFTIVSGAGTISPSGLYTAPLSVTSSQSTISIEVSDGTGSVGYATFYMNVSAIAQVPASFSPNPAYTSQNITITATSGNAPFTYSLISGSGILNGSVYTASSVAETAQIQVRDATGVTSILSIPITTFNVMTYLSVSPLGQHVPGGGACAASTYQIGSLADADPYRIYGDQILCGAVNPKEQAAQIITDVLVTAGGQHVNGGLACPSGYSLAGQISDCQGGRCGGQQSVCTQMMTPTSGNTSLSGVAVLDFYVTPPNVHATLSATGPACNAGYTQVGFAADCGFGVCNGLQSFCMKK